MVFGSDDEKDDKQCAHSRRSLSIRTLDAHAANVTEFLSVSIEGIPVLKSIAQRIHRMPFITNMTFKLANRARLSHGPDSVSWSILSKVVSDAGG